MNGIHDMGGMHDMGPIQPEPVQPEKDEPVFHAPWEGRVFALRRAMGAWRKWNIDTSRYEIELVPPAEYLSLSYYARQLAAFLEMLVKSGLVLRTEIESARTPSMFIRCAFRRVSCGVPQAAPRDSVYLAMWDDYLEPV
jgi:nitrile hydratase